MQLLWYAMFVASRMHLTDVEEINCWPIDSAFEIDTHSAQHVNQSGEP